ncbi:hypothetical protein [Streptomyces sp. NPDC001381]|uniref:hypothetical protein n=1 Tax=Streptomyces sp. NPDC001381 TaxID=3364567 RepID=UPI0036A718BF
MDPAAGRERRRRTQRVAGGDATQTVRALGGGVLVPVLNFASTAPLSSTAPSASAAREAGSAYAPAAGERQARHGTTAQGPGRPR